MGDADGISNTFPAADAVLGSTPLPSTPRPSRKDPPRSADDKASPHAKKPNRRTLHDLQSATESAALAGLPSFPVVSSGSLPSGSGFMPAAMLPVAPTQNLFGASVGGSGVKEEQSDAMDDSPGIGMFDSDFEKNSPNI